MHGTHSEAADAGAFPGAPALSADPCRLVPFGERHFTHAYVGWLNDPEVVRFSENRHRRHDRESCARYVAGFAVGPSLLWAIEDPEGRHVGNISAGIDPSNRLADIGILIGAATARGRGYGLAAWTAVLDHLRTREDLDKITGGCLSTNVPMLRIMERAGMVEDGLRRAHYLWEGRRVDLVYRAVYRGALARTVGPS